MTAILDNCVVVDKLELINEPVFGTKRNNVLNFSAGPAKLPEEVMMKAQLEFREYKNTGIGVLEMSHRSPEFDDMLNSTKSILRELMSVPNDYELLFLQGGGTGQMAAVPLNLMNFSKGDKPSADYLVTGQWSKKAFAEANKFLTANQVLPTPLKTFNRVPDQSKWTLNPDAAYVYYCANETIHGVEVFNPPETKSVPLVADISSNILSRPMDVKKHGLMFAGAQKNIGAAGLTVVVARKDLLGKAAKHCPSILDYGEQAKMKSVLNTPPVFSIYLTKLVLEWIKAKGGVDAMQQRNLTKSRLVYDVIDDSLGFYSGPVELEWRSRMNVPFRICGLDGQPDVTLEGQFLKGARDKGMVSLKGHRVVGGIRASLYNAVTEHETQQLVDYMNEFMELNKIET